MGVDHLGQAGLQQQIHELWRAVRRISKATLQNSSIGRAVLRFYAGGRIQIEDGGGIDILGAGYITIDGDLSGSGDFDWTGPWEFSGDGTISGDVSLDGDLSLGSGRILAGPLIIDKAGGYGARVYSTGTLLLDASGNIVLGANAQALGTLHAIGDLSTNSDLSVLGSSTVLGAKSFRMPHPLKDEHWLQHGCTESPISGTEYTGRATIGADGSAVVELPDYFEALNKARNRTVQVTPIGRPFLVGAEDVGDGRVTVYGDPGREVFWLVKAERTGGDFETESPIPPAPVSYD